MTSIHATCIPPAFSAGCLGPWPPLALQRKNGAHSELPWQRLCMKSLRRRPSRRLLDKVFAARLFSGHFRSLC